MILSAISIGLRVVVAFAILGLAIVNPRLLPYIAAGFLLRFLGPRLVVGLGQLIRNAGRLRNLNAGALRNLSIRQQVVGGVVGIGGLLAVVVSTLEFAIAPSSKPPQPPPPLTVAALDFVGRASYKQGSWHVEDRVVLPAAVKMLIEKDTGVSVQQVMNSARPKWHLKERQLTPPADIYAQSRTIPDPQPHWPNTHHWKTISAPQIELPTLTLVPKSGSPYTLATPSGLVAHVSPTCPAPRSRVDS